jgi:hypothetical protein
VFAVSDDHGHAVPTPTHPNAYRRKKKYVHTYPPIHTDAGTQNDGATPPTLTCLTPSQPAPDGRMCDVDADAGMRLGDKHPGSM